jgi:hypothetical protein
VPRNARAERICEDAFGAAIRSLASGGANYFFGAFGAGAVAGRWVGGCIVGVFGAGCCCGAGFPGAGCCGFEFAADGAGFDCGCVFMVVRT